MIRWKRNLKYIPLRKIFFALCSICLVTFFVCFLLLKKDSISPKVSEHTLCVLVPFRNAEEELFEFIPFMNRFLRRQSIRFHFVVVNHVPDNHRFNKGSTFNAGFEIITQEYPDCDYIALHDIDLLPLNDEISYGYPGDDVFHAAHPDLHPRGEKYDPERYIGGIAIINLEQYIRVNGFGNQFWGWGGEDRNFFYRLRNNNVTRVRPSNLTTNRNNTFKDIHSPNRFRDWKKCGDQITIGKNIIENDFETGLKNVKYELTNVHSLTIDEVSFPLYSISVPCNYSRTPWCTLDCPQKRNPFRAPKPDQRVGRFEEDSIVSTCSFDGVANISRFVSEMLKIG